MLFFAKGMGMASWSPEGILVILLFLVAAAVAVWRTLHPRQCNIFTTIVSEKGGCAEQAIGSIKDALGRVYFFCKNHDPRAEWLYIRLRAQKIYIDKKSVVLFQSPFFLDP